MPVSTLFGAGGTPGGSGPRGSAGAAAAPRLVARDGDACAPPAPLGESGPTTVSSRRK
jgi:hypothetical protein